MQLGGLLLDGGDDFGMAVAGGDDGDAGAEIQEDVAVDVFDERAAAASGHQRIAARVRRREVLPIEFEDANRVGTRQRSHQVRKSRFCHSHRFLPKKLAAMRPRVQRK